MKIHHIVAACLAATMLLGCDIAPQGSLADDNSASLSRADVEEIAKEVCNDQLGELTAQFRDSLSTRDSVYNDYNQRLTTLSAKFGSLKDLLSKLQNDRKKEGQISWGTFILCLIPCLIALVSLVLSIVAFVRSRRGNKQGGLAEEDPCKIKRGIDYAAVQKKVTEAVALLQQEVRHLKDELVKLSASQQSTMTQGNTTSKQSCPDQKPQPAAQKCYFPGPASDGAYFLEPVFVDSSDLFFYGEIDGNVAKFWLKEQLIDTIKSIKNSLQSVVVFKGNAQEAKSFKQKPGRAVKDASGRWKIKDTDKAIVEFI